MSSLQIKEIIETEAKITPVVLASGKGCKLYDVEGREYLDLSSGFAVNALGHGDQDWLKAVVHQANTLTHVSNVYYTIPQVELAKKLVGTSFADRIFFTNSGTEANEAAIKFARKFQRHKNPDDKEPATNFVSFSNSSLLVFDEVQCGLGRTGYLWAHEAFGVFPDIMTLAKPLAGGLPIGAALVTERVASAIAYGDHGSTFAGAPLVCNAALAVLNKISDSSFLSSVSTKGLYFKAILNIKLGGNPHVKEIRGFGLILGIELDVSASPLVDACRSAGLLVLTAGKGNVVRLVPPLIITEQELDQAAEILFQALPVLDEKNSN